MNQSILQWTYQNVFRRSSSFVGFIIVGALVTEAITNTVSDGLFHTINRGKMWKDVKHKYIE